MKIIGFRFTKISGEKFKEPEGSIGLRSNFNLGEIRKEESSDKKESVFSLEFTNTLDYDDMAKIEFKGAVFISVNSKVAKELGKNKTITDPENRKFILDFILKRVHVESLHVEERLNLPFHIQPPTVNLEKKEK